MPQPGTRRSAEAPAPAAGTPRRTRGGWPARLWGSVAQALDLPQDLMFDLPRLMLMGNLHLSVENHRGLVELRSDRVAIATRLGRVVVLGKELTVGVVREGQITVTGRLAAVRFEPEAPDASPSAAPPGRGDRDAGPVRG